MLFVFFTKKKYGRDKFTLKRAPVALRLFIEPTVAVDAGAVCLVCMCALVLGAHTTTEVVFRRAEEGSAREKVAELASMPKENKRKAKLKGLRLHLIF